MSNGEVPTPSAAEQKSPMPKCACTADPFADLPPELRPPAAPRQDSLRKVSCPRCGLEYWTNRKTDLCMRCEQKPPP